MPCLRTLLPPPHQHPLTRPSADVRRVQTALRLQHESCSHDCPIAPHARGQCQPIGPGPSYSSPSHRRGRRAATAGRPTSAHPRGDSYPSGAAPSPCSVSVGSGQSWTVQRGPGPPAALGCPTMICMRVREIRSCPQHRQAIVVLQEADGERTLAIAADPDESCGSRVNDRGGRAVRIRSTTFGRSTPRLRGYADPCGAGLHAGRGDRRGCLRSPWQSRSCRPLLPRRHIGLGRAGPDPPFT
jgi:hypothetical protein